jgi:hypothetical protein
MNHNFVHDRRGTSEENVQMSRSTSIKTAVTLPAPLRPATLRAGLALGVAAALAAFVVRLLAVGF